MAISKFESKVVDKAEKLVKKLTELAQGKKPDEQISISVKKIGLLIQDLESIANDIKTGPTDEEKKEAEAKEEKKKESTPPAEDDSKDKKDATPPEEKADEKKEEKKPAEKVDESGKKEEKKPETKETPDGEKKDDPDKAKEEAEKADETPPEDKADAEEGKEGEEESLSKMEEALKLSEEYKKLSESKDQEISKLQDELKTIKDDKEKTDEKLSKFVEDSHTKLLNSTVKKVSKMQNYTLEEELGLKKSYLEKSMSNQALEELSKMADNQMIANLNDPMETTKPSEYLSPATVEKQDISKMSHEDQVDVRLDQLANMHTKLKGFVE